MQQIDADIISRCKAGDKAAFRTVVQNCQGMVYSLSLKMLADIEEAKDVVQDTFIKVWQNLASYDDRYSFNTWVYTIASRLCLDRSPWTPCWDTRTKSICISEECLPGQMTL